MTSTELFEMFKDEEYDSSLDSYFLLLFGHDY